MLDRTHASSVTAPPDRWPRIAPPAPHLVVLHLCPFWSPQHWQQFEPQLTLWDLFVANKEVQELLEQGRLLLDRRCVGWGEVRKTDKEGPVGARALALVEGDD